MLPEPEASIFPLHYNCISYRKGCVEMRMMLVPLLGLIAAAAAVPPPSWFFDGAEEGILNLEAFIESSIDARSRGVDAPNPRYGIHNPPFGPDGAIAGTDAQMNVLILLVDFSDNVAQTPAVYFDSMGYAADTFSLSEYYSEISFGQIDIVTLDWPSSTDWQRAPETYEYYVDGQYGWGTYPQNSQGMVEDVCELVDAVVDFADYDNDSDGYVDGVNVMFAGTFDGTPDTIWPHAWSLPGSGVLFDGVYVSAFSVQNEYDNTPGDKSAAVFCHEFGHVVGLPDLYDYDYDSSGIGDWGLMSYGVYNGAGWSPAHVCAWCRIALGVTTCINVTVEGDYEVPAVETDGTVYRLWTGGSANPRYFLLSNRRPIGYDAALPSWGTLIWHIDENVSNNNNQWYPGYTSNGHYKVAIEQADGLWQLEKYSGYGNAGDPYPGTTSNEYFNCWTVPDSKGYFFQDSNVAIGPIPSTQDTVTIHMSVTETGIEGGGSTGHPSLSVTSPNPVTGLVDFSIVHAGGLLTLEIFDIAGHLVSVPICELAAAGSHQATWDSHGAVRGVYIARLRSGEAAFNRKLVVAD
jgi:immune inhibitor A